MASCSRADAAAGSTGGRLVMGRSWCGDRWLLGVLGVLSGLLGACGGVDGVPGTGSSSQLRHAVSSAAEPGHAEGSQALAALSMVWEEVYAGPVPQVLFTVHWVGAEQLIALGRAPEVTGVAYDTGTVASGGHTATLWLNRELSPARQCGLLVHELAHGFEYATAVSDTDHATPEVWSSTGIVARAQSLALQLGCVQPGEQAEHSLQLQTASFE